MEERIFTPRQFDFLELAKKESWLTKNFFSPHALHFSVFGVNRILANQKIQLGGFGGFGGFGGKDFQNETLISSGRDPFEDFVF